MKRKPESPKDLKREIVLEDKMRADIMKQLQSKFAQIMITPSYNKKKKKKLTTDNIRFKKKHAIIDL